MTDKTLLILDDDTPFRTRLCRAMETRGFTVIDAGTVSDGIDLVRKAAPAYAVLDMKLDDGTGLSLGTVNNYMGSKILPHIKVGKARNSRVLFPLGEVVKVFPELVQKYKEGHS